jgi:hypothetical protein
MEKDYKMGWELDRAGYSRRNILFAVNTQCAIEPPNQTPRIFAIVQNSTRIHAMLRGYHYWR